MTDVQYIIQGGAVGIALIALWIIYKLVTNHDNHLLDALKRNTDAWVDHSKVMARFTSALEKLTVDKSSKSKSKK